MIFQSTTLSKVSGQWVAHTTVTYNYKGTTKVIRSYTKPVNHTYVKRFAARDVMRKATGWYKLLDAQGYKINDTWEDRLLDVKITGYKNFMRFAKGNYISVPYAVNGQGKATVQITYTLKIKTGHAHIYRWNQTLGITEDITTTPLIERGKNKVFNDTVNTSGTYQYGLAYTKYLLPGDTPPKIYQMAARWTPESDYGHARLAQCVVKITAEQPPPPPPEMVKWCSGTNPTIYANQICAICRERQSYLGPCANNRFIICLDCGCKLKTNLTTICNECVLKRN